MNTLSTIPFSIEQGTYVPAENYTATITILLIYWDGTKYRLTFKRDYPYRPELTDFENQNAETFKEAVSRNPGKAIVYTSSKLFLKQPDGKIEDKEIFLPQLFLKGQIISCI